MRDRARASPGRSKRSRAGSTGRLAAPGPARRFAGQRCPASRCRRRPRVASYRGDHPGRHTRTAGERLPACGLAGTAAVGGQNRAVPLGLLAVAAAPARRASSFSNGAGGPAASVRRSAGRSAPLSADCSSRRTGLISPAAPGISMMRSRAEIRTCSACGLGLPAISSRGDPAVARPSRTPRAGVVLVHRRLGRQLVALRHRRPRDISADRAPLRGPARDHALVSRAAWSCARTGRPGCASHSPGARRRPHRNARSPRGQLPAGGQFGPPARRRIGECVSDVDADRRTPLCATDFERGLETPTASR